MYDGVMAELTPKGRNLRRQALKFPPAVVEHLHEALTRINAALAAGTLDSELDR